MNMLLSTCKQITAWLQKNSMVIKENYEGHLEKSKGRFYFTKKPQHRPTLK